MWISILRRMVTEEQRSVL
jgi:serine/threonine protein kinase